MFITVALPKTHGVSVTGDKPKFSRNPGLSFLFQLANPQDHQLWADKEKDVSVRGKWSIMGKGGKNAE